MTVEILTGDAILLRLTEAEFEAYLDWLMTQN